jgi:ATP-dependent protease ClpP protease subunit
MKTLISVLLSLLCALAAQPILAAPGDDGWLRTLPFTTATDAEGGQQENEAESEALTTCLYLWSADINSASTAEALQFVANCIEKEGYPILVLNDVKGHVPAAMGFFDLIRTNDFHIAVRVSGEISRAAVMILMAADTREITPNASMQFGKIGVGEFIGRGNPKADAAFAQFLQQRWEMNLVRATRMKADVLTKLARQGAIKTGPELGELGLGEVLRFPAPGQCLAPDEVQQNGPKVNI